MVTNHGEHHIPEKKGEKLEKGYHRNGAQISKKRAGIEDGKGIPPP